MRAVTAAETERAWEAWIASGHEPEGWMLMYAEAGRWAFKHIDSRRYESIPIRGAS